jgi:D-glycero-D-manno-heptose 1,7-bisphosphate phosphatase
LIVVKRAVFLDRDGVITQDPPHYAHKPEQLKLIPGAAESIRTLNDLDILVIVVSNQSGVARGYYTEEDVAIYNKVMEEELQKENARVDAIYYCPHHPEVGDSKYKIACDCRKPGTGLLALAAKEHKVELKDSFLIGDKMSDIMAGESAGCSTILVLTGHGKKEFEKGDGEFDYSAPSIVEAVDWIVDKIKGAS